MKVKKLNELKNNTGMSILIYASPGTGKTYGMQYLPGRTLIIDVDHGTKCIPEENEHIDVFQVESNLSSS